MPLEATAGMSRISARSIPFPLRCQLFFGGTFNIVGWLFFGFGLAFFWIFTMNADISFLTFRGEVKTVIGEVTRSEETHATENKKQIYANNYSFTVNGKEFENVSFSTGRRLSTGQNVKIEYLKENPSKSRIAGMRQKMFGTFALITTLFPAVGMGLIGIGLRNGIRAIRLLGTGILTRGKLTSKVKMGGSKDGRPFYKLGFSFQAEDGRNYEIFSQTSSPEKLEDDQLEPLIYSRFKPSDGLTLDDLPGSPQMDEMEHIRGGSFAGCIGLMIPPALTFIGHGAYIWLHFLS
jgi:hypothetical protein